MNDETKNPLRMLCVEDDPVYAHYLQASLEAHGVVLTHVTRLDAALEKLRETSWDGILLDLTLPDSNGLDTCRTLCQESGGVPVIVITSGDDDAMTNAAIMAGANDYLVKGNSNVSYMMRRIRYAMQRKKHERPGRRWSRVPCSALVAQVAGATDCEESEKNTSAAGPDSMTPTSATALIESVLGSDTRPLRVLHVDDDPVFAQLVEKTLTGSLTVRCDVERVDRLEAALRRLEKQAYDAVLLDIEVPDGRGLEGIAEVQAFTSNTPILLASDSHDDAVAIESLRWGLDDFLVKSEMNSGNLGRCFRMALIRRAAQSASLSSQLRDNMRALPAEPLALPFEDRRAESRYFVTRSLFAIPVLRGCQPDEARCAEGFTVDISSGGIAFEVAAIDAVPTSTWVVGVEGDDGEMRFATAEARRVVTTALGLRFHCQLLPAERDFLRLQNCLPQLDRETYRFATGLSPEALDKWTRLGVLRRRVLDRVLACPRCAGLPTMRSGCRACGSARLQRSKLIHHFACAYVGFVADFEGQGEMVCPKCRTRQLIVGSDFEYLDGPFRCLDCNWSHTELELIGHCLACDLRFPFEQAVEEELVGYHVERLDPLAFLAAP